MELLLSNIPPLRSENQSFADCFHNLMSKSDRMRIASGYISTESLTEIKKIIESNGKPYLDLMIGMHYYDGITRPQYEAATYLNEFLLSKEMGQVSVATTFKFHGKLYSFEKEGQVFAGIMGSSNFGSMTNIHRNFETDILLTEKQIVSEIDSFIQKASASICMPVSDWNPEKFIENNNILEGQDHVEKVSKDKLVNIKNKMNGISFELPVKTAEKSNLNCYFGKGRKSSNGFIKPRHWYEAELIVPKIILDNDSYPQAISPATITVYTDDGWEFECTRNGDYGKNFRSYYDLKILGKWIKGRLENSASLQVGQMVTTDVLNRYGRNTITLNATSDPKIWILDFGV